MSQLERAATELRDRPTAPPSPIEAIERRAGSLRRRRRLFEAGAIVLAILVLGTAGLALSAARGGDDDQGVFVGEGVDLPGAFSVATYRLVDPQEGIADGLEQTIEARFRWASAGDAVVKVDGSEVTVSASTAIAADRFDTLVTAPGGFTLRTVVGPVDPLHCDAGGSAALWTSAIVGPPQCLSVEPPISLPTPPAVESGSSSSLSGGYQTDLTLTPAASQAYLDGTTDCFDASPSCDHAFIGVESGGALLDPSAAVMRKVSQEADRMEIAIPGFTDEADAQMWAALLTHPLLGVTLVRVEPAPSASTTVTTTASSTNVPSASYTVSTSKVCLVSKVDDSTLAAAASVLHERFGALGRTVEVTPLDQKDLQPYLGCDSGQALSLGGSYDPAEVDWAADLAAMVMAGDLRTVLNGVVLTPTSASAHATIGDRPTLIIGLPPAVIEAIDRAGTLPTGDRMTCSIWIYCWLRVKIDGTVPTEDVVISTDRTSLVLTLRVGDEAYAVREAILLTHPLPAGVALVPS